MSERYTEKARRVIFFARYEASQFGSPYIESEHFLLGILREDKRLTNRLFKSHVSVESIRKQIEARTDIREKTSTSVDIPVSNECKHVMAYAAEEAERLASNHIGPEHLMLGLLREEKCFAAEILKERGIQLDLVREQIGQGGTEAPVVSSAASRTAAAKPPLVMFNDLTQSAAEGTLGTLIAREMELDCMVEVLCSRRRRNALLLGERGVGKTAIVEGLAQRIADGKVPATLQGKRILAIEPDLLVSWTWDRHFDRFLTQLSSTSPIENLILFVRGSEGFLPATIKSGMLNIAAIVRFTLQAGIQCLAAGRPGEYNAASESSPWLHEFFRSVYVRPMDEATTLLVLRTRKDALEQFHEVLYSDEALTYAAEWSGSHLPGGCLPGRALELLDAAGTRVKLRQVVPPDIADVLKRLNFVAKKEEDAISNHEFEKARFYSDEARKERENLQTLRERHGMAGTSSTNVERRDLEEVIASWSQYPYSDRKS
jgi:ATP-dependent Clp protease ATP-binding subunit ClpC